MDNKYGREEEFYQCEYCTGVLTGRNVASAKETEKCFRIILNTKYYNES